MNPWPICGDCPACLARTNALLRVPRRTLLPGPRPTAAALERHARRFGPGQVAETAAEYGLSVALEAVQPIRRFSRPSLKARITALIEDGHSAEVIAEMENLSASRARRLVKELS